jgi:CBS domain-containing protein
MQTMGTATEVLIYIGESDKWGHKPLYMAILEMLKQEDCAGATVIRGLAGFGAASRIHTATIVALSEDLPLVIHWVDLPDRVERVMPRLLEMVAEGLITVHEVQVVAYTHRRLRELRQGAPVQDIMHREVKSVRANTPLAEAAELLLTKTYHALPVIDDQRHVVGILTDGDLLNRAGLLAVTAQRELTSGELTRELAALRDSRRTVAEVMTPNPVTVKPNITIAEAVRMMAEFDIKRLPVVDDGDRLIGIVSRLDVLRALSQPIAREAPQPVPPPGRHLKVGDIMMTDVPAMPAGAPLNEVVDHLIGTAQRRVVVVDEGHQVVGIITDADILNRARESERPALIQSLTQRAPVEQESAIRLAKRTAADVMTRNPVTVQPGTPLLDALQLLLAHKIKRLPVVDGEGRLVGLVGRGGILEALSREV